MRGICSDCPGRSAAGSSSSARCRARMPRSPARWSTWVAQLNSSATTTAGVRGSNERGVLVAVDLQQDVVRQSRGRPAGCGEVGRGSGEGVDAGRDAPGGVGAEEFGHVTLERRGAAGLGHDDGPVAAVVQAGGRTGHDAARHGQLSGAHPGQAAAQVVGADQKSLAAAAEVAVACGWRCAVAARWREHACAGLDARRRVGWPTFDPPGRCCSPRPPRTEVSALRARTRDPCPVRSALSVVVPSAFSRAGPSA